MKFYYEDHKDNLFSLFESNYRDDDFKLSEKKSLYSEPIFVLTLESLITEVLPNNINNKQINNPEYIHNNSWLSYEIDNTKSAWKLIKTNNFVYSIDFILKLHKTLKNNPFGKEDISGTFRKVTSIPKSSRFYNCQPTLIQNQLEILFEKYNSCPKSFYHICLFHNIFLFIHPFKDGNGRIAKLLLNHELIKRYSAYCIIPANQFNEYESALELAKKGDLKELISFINRKSLKYE